MFQFCNDCIYEYVNAQSWISPLAQSVTATAASIALVVAWRNLNGLQRTQSLQAQMNLITLENEVRKNHSQFKIAVEKHSRALNEESEFKNLPTLTVEKDSSYEIYISSADKLAALIKSDFLVNQFRNRNWQEEYSAIFEKVKTYSQGNVDSNDDLRGIRNIDILLTEWKV